MILYWLIYFLHTGKEKLEFEFFSITTYDSPQK